MATEKDFREYIGRLMEQQQETKNRLEEFRQTLYKEYLIGLYDDNRDEDPEFLIQSPATLTWREVLLRFNTLFGGHDPSCLAVWYERKHVGQGICEYLARWREQGEKDLEILFPSPVSLA